MGTSKQLAAISRAFLAISRPARSAGGNDSSVKSKAPPLTQILPWRPPANSALTIRSVRSTSSRPQRWLGSLGEIIPEGRPPALRIVSTTAV